MDSPRHSALEALLEMNAVSLHQTDRLFEPMKLGDASLAVHLHPYTCGNDSTHTPLFPMWDSKSRKVRLICRDCDWTQEYHGARLDLAATRDQRWAAVHDAIIDCLGHYIAPVQADGAFLADTIRRLVADDRFVDAVRGALWDESIHSAPHDAPAAQAAAPCVSGQREVGIISQLCEP